MCKRDRLLERVGRGGFAEYSDFEISDSRNAFRSMAEFGGVRNTAHSCNRWIASIKSYQRFANAIYLP